MCRPELPNFTVPILTSSGRFRYSHAMPQSLSNCLIHAIWSTKDRFPFLTDKAVRNEFHSIIGGISARLNCPTIIVGGVADHVHILMRLARTITIADWVKETKRASTIWMQRQRARDPMLAKFKWQAGYADFSVSESNVTAVRSYIASQERHHKKMSFQDEYRKFLTANKLAWAEGFVWD